MVGEILYVKDINLGEIKSNGRNNNNDSYRCSDNVLFNRIVKRGYKHGNDSTVDLYVYNHVNGGT